ncbi:MAG: ABC transporter ATP-binding protein [Alphaproteobacteria bacterium]|nr:ABC transporter ATP-binding protein [Alphaproteobacteria bacterium]
MFKNLITFLHLCWISATTKALKAKLLSNIPVSLIGGITAFTAPLFLSWIVKSLNNKQSEEALVWFYALLGATAFGWITRFYWRYVVEPASTVIEMNLRQIYFKKLFNKPYAWHLNNSVGYFSGALERVCMNIHMWLCDFPMDFLPAIILVLCFFGYTLSISIWLFIYFVASLTLLIILTRLLFNKRIGYIDSLTAQMLKFNKLFIDFLYNVRSVKKMNLMGFATTRTKKQSKEVIQKAEQMMHYNAKQWGAMEFIMQGMTLGPIGYFLYQYIQTGNGLDVVVMIAAIAPQLEQTGRRMMYFMTASAKVLTEYSRLAEHLGDVEITEPTQTIKNWKNITFENTYFEFVKDGHIFHHKVPFFKIQKGDKIAVVGRSGEGKSTFLNLLTGQFPCQSGDIRVDKHSYQDLGQAFFDKYITYISQDVELFDMSLYDNIVMGKHVSHETLQKIIDGCQLGELIARMDGNMHNDIGEKGVKVSAGEKQRINLARGLLLNRDILVLDEITANLDPATTQKIWEFIFTEYADKTIIAVSHEKDLLNHIERRLEFKRGFGKEI